MDYVPEVSIVDQTATSGIVVDEETWKMVEGLPCSRPSTVQRAAGERGGQHGGAGEAGVSVAMPQSAAGRGQGGYARQGGRGGGKGGRGGGRR